MKTQLNSVILSLGIIIFGVSCTKTPVACGTIPATGTVSTAISFNSHCSTDGHHYEWDFGDGAKSTEAHASHTYNNAGVYTVKLSVMSMNSKKMDELTQSITIN